jgi:bacterioferritin-associated ferredoxin
VCLATGAGRNCGGCVHTLKRLLCQHDSVNSESRLEGDHATNQLAGSGAAQ